MLFLQYCFGEKHPEKILEWWFQTSGAKCGSCNFPESPLGPSQA